MTLVKLIGVAALAAIIQGSSVAAAVLVDTGLQPALALTASMDDFSNDDGSVAYTTVHESASRFTVAAGGTATSIRVARAGSDADYKIFRDAGGALVQNSANLIWQAGPFDISTFSSLPPAYDIFTTSIFGKPSFATYSSLDVALAAGAYWFVLDAADGTGIDTQLIAGSGSGSIFNQVYQTGPGGSASSVYSVGPQLSLRIDGTVAGAVPEPASWTLMIGGFGATGTMLRTRRRAVPAKLADRSI